MDKVCDAEEYRGPVKLTFLDRTIFCAYKIRFPDSTGLRLVYRYTKCMHTRTYTRMYVHVRVKTRQILLEYPQICFLSGRWYKFRCMRVSIHGPLYIPVTFELSTCSESSVCNANARFRGSTRSVVSGSLVQGEETRFLLISIRGKRL